MSKPIRLSADLGEGAQVEALLMPHLTYCNIACGGHYGNEISMRHAVNLAKINKVKIGAHPSYPDKKNFGRKIMDISTAAFEKTLKSQLSSFKKVCLSLGAQIYHAKAHGALYHDIVSNNKLREVYLKVVFDTLGDVKIMIPGHVTAIELGLNESEVIYEAFGDRRYNDQLQLMSRSIKDAILEDIDEIEGQIIMMSQQEMLTSHMGRSYRFRSDTICLHGDHPQLRVYFPKLIQNLKIQGLLK
jgi:UPF0271 protein